MFKILHNHVKTLTNKDDMFYIKDGMYVTPRAGFIINQKCPTEYRMILNTCMQNGWLQPVAYMRDNEYTWEQLKK